MNVTVPITSHSHDFIPIPIVHKPSSDRLKMLLEQMTTLFYVSNVLILFADAFDERTDKITTH